MEECDALHTSSTLTDDLFTERRACFREDQILELLMLAGFYRAISYVVRGTRRDAGA